MRSTTLGYMPALDGLRAVAVAMVFFVHAFKTPFPGGLGVDIFFVISGFLITRILLRQVQLTGRINLARFYVARLLRLYPALLMVCAAVIVLYLFYDRRVPTERIEHAAITATYTSNIYMTISGEMIDPLSHTWSLAMEEQFYLVWPATLMIMCKLSLSRPIMTTITAGMALASLLGWVWFGLDAPYNPLTKAGGLLVGCTLAFLVSDRPRHHLGLGYACLVGICAVIAAETLGVFGRDISMPLVTLLIPGVILMAAFGDGPLVRALSGRVIVHIGVVSYGIYLWHYPTLYVLHALGADGLPGALVALVLTLVVTELSFRFVESPALRLKARLQMRARAPQDA